MKNKLFLSMGCFLLLSVYVSAASNNTEKTVAECAKLLPQDRKQYELNLSVIIDKVRASTGNLTISDDSKRELSDKEKATVKPYVYCVKRLIK